MCKIVIGCEKILNAVSAPLLYTEHMKGGAIMWPLILVIAAAVVIAIIIAKRPVNGKKTSKSDYSDFFSENEKKN